MTTLQEVTAMYYDSNLFQDRVTKGEDGVYRWTYRMNPRRNKYPLLIVGRVFVAMAAIRAIGLFIVGSPNPGHMADWEMPLMVTGIFLGVFLLVTGLLYLQGDDPLPFAMDEEAVTTFRAKGAGPHSFRRMRRVRFMPQHDAIRLGFGATIYVPAQDYDLVKAFILDHLPAETHIR